MASIMHESVKTSSTEAKIEAIPKELPPTDENVPDMKGSITIQEDKIEYIKGFKLYSVLLGLTLVAFLVMLDQTIVVTALPKISEEFDSLQDIGKSFFFHKFSVCRVKIMRDVQQLPLDSVLNLLFHGTFFVAICPHSNLSRSILTRFVRLVRECILIDNVRYH